MCGGFETQGVHEVVLLRVVDWTTCCMLMQCRGRGTACVLLSSSSRRARLLRESTAVGSTDRHCGTHGDDIAFSDLASPTTLDVPTSVDETTSSSEVATIPFVSDGPEGTIVVKVGATPRPFNPLLLGTNAPAWIGSDKLGDAQFQQRIPRPRHDARTDAGRKLEQFL